MYQNAAECLKIRSKTVKRKQERWWDNQCEQIKKEKYKALRFLRQNNTLENLNKYKEFRNKFKDTCKEKKLEYQRRNWEELIESRQNSNLFWKTVKNLDIKCHKLTLFGQINVLNILSTYCILKMLVT